MVLAWENLQEVFVILVVVVVVFTSMEVFHFIVFRRHPSPFRELSPVFTPILYFQPRSSQSDLRHFHFNFSRLFYCKCYHFEWVFFTHWRFLLYTPSFVTQIEQKHSIQDPPLCLLSQSCPPADAWTWTIDVWIIRPLIYQLRQWATKYRVKIEPLNMFCLFNVICKDY